MAATDVEFETLALARAQLAIDIYALQVAGHLSARSDGKPLDVLLVEAGLGQSTVGALLGKSKQAVNFAVNKFANSAKKSGETNG